MNLPAPHRAAGETPAARLRAAFAAPGIIRAVGAHDALGARLAERAGFDAVWCSGLEVSASHGVPDAEILTMSEMLTAAQWMSAAVSIPIVADCDTGFGNATNVAHMVRRYEAAGVAAVCIEDKPFPKSNSFLPIRQRLVSVAEFEGKLAAAKAAQSDPDFMVIGRVEAMIVGMSVDEALLRSEAYAAAGADAILIHSKSESPQDVLDFLAAWTLPTPIVVVPTTYHAISGAELERAGAKLVIYANQGLRASIKAMSDAFDAIRDADGTTTVEPRIAPLSAVFEIQGAGELLAHDAIYVRGLGAGVKAVIAGTSSDELGEGEGSVLSGQVESLRASGIADVTVVAPPTPPRAQEIESVTVRVDERWDELGPVGAFLSLCPEERGVAVFAAADTLFDAELIRRMLGHNEDVVVAVNARDARGGGEREVLCAKDVIGLARLTPRGLALARRELVRQTAVQAGGGPPGLGDVVAGLAASGTVKTLPCTTGWTTFGSIGEPVLARSPDAT